MFHTCHNFIRRSTMIRQYRRNFLPVLSSALLFLKREIQDPMYTIKFNLSIHSPTMFTEEIVSNNSKMTDIKKDEKCLFCNIENSSTEIIYQDEEYLAFRDIKPAASHHYLIIPRNHIKNTSCLSASHLSLVKKLIEIGEGILRSNSVDVLDKYDARFGFHVPPFNSIQHLHLHVIYPVSEIGFLGRLIFKPDSYWFMDASTLIEKLEKSVTSENTN